MDFSVDDREVEAAAEAASQARPGSPILIAGHSHMRALIAEHSYGGHRSWSYGVQSPPRPCAGHAPWPRPDDYWDKLEANSGGAHVAVIWGGNEHNLHYFFQGQHPFDVVSRHVRKRQPTVSLIPQRLALAQLRREISSIGGWLHCIASELAKGPAKSIGVIGTPPPKKDNEALRKDTDKVSPFS